MFAPILEGFKMKNYKLVCFNQSNYDSYSEALESGGTYELHHSFNYVLPLSKKTITVCRAAYASANCLDGGNGLTIVIVGNKDGATNGHIWPHDVGLDDNCRLKS